MTEEQQPQHVTPEDMIARGEEFATFEDLEGLDTEVLQAIAQLCPVEVIDATICVPCRASVTIAERYQALVGQSSAGPSGDSIPFEETPDEEPQVVPELLDLANRVITADRVRVPLEAPESLPIAEQFAAKVKELDVFVQTMLSGPPIPPKEVTLPELALLTMGADRWVRMTKAQGVDLAPQQQQMLDMTEALVARLRP